MKPIDPTKLSLDQLKALVANHERLKATGSSLYHEAKALLEKRPAGKAAAKNWSGERLRRPMADGMDAEIRNALVRRGYVASTTPELGGSGMTAPMACTASRAGRPAGARAASTAAPPTGSRSRRRRTSPAGMRNAQTGLRPAAAL